MMNIKGAKINWCKGYGNFPTLEVTVDAIPTDDMLVYERAQFSKDAVFYFAQLGDYVHFLCHSLNNQRGFGGGKFRLTLKSGETIEIKGPWSSNSIAMNDFGFPRSMEVTYNIEDKYKIHGAMLESKALELIESAGASYTWIHEHDDSKESNERTEFYNHPVIKFSNAMTLIESQKHKNRICSCDERPVEYCPIHGISAQLNRSQME